MLYDESFLHDKLLQILSLEQKTKNLFVGQSFDLVGPRVFGGQIIGQSIIAAGKQLVLPVKSLHAYFIRPGKINLPIFYVSEDLVVTEKKVIKKVKAYQENNLIYMAMIAFESFNTIDENHVLMDIYPSPSDLEDEQYHKDKLRKVYNYLDEYGFDQPFIIHSKPFVFNTPFCDDPEEPLFNEYFKTYKKLLDSHLLHQAIVAFYSDYNLLTMSLKPHAISYLDKNVQTASLDHVMHFHSNFKADDWILYQLNATRTTCSRGLNQGLMWQDGRCICTIFQESLLRVER